MNRTWCSVVSERIISTCNDTVVGVGRIKYERALKMITITIQELQLQVLLVLTRTAFSITFLILSVHHQNCIINLYFHLSPQVFVDPRGLALFVLSGTGEVESLIGQRMR